MDSIPTMVGRGEGDLFSRCFSGMAGDCKIGWTKRIKDKVGRERGLGKGLDWGSGTAVSIKFPDYCLWKISCPQTSFYFLFYFIFSLRTWLYVVVMDHSKWMQIDIKEKKSFKQDVLVMFKPRPLGGSGSLVWRDRLGSLDRTPGKQWRRLCARPRSPELASPSFDSISSPRTQTPDTLLDPAWGFWGNALFLFFLLVFNFYLGTVWGIQEFSTTLTPRVCVPPPMSQGPHPTDPSPPFANSALLANSPLSHIGERSFCILSVPFPTADFTR